MSYSFSTAKLYYPTEEQYVMLYNTFTYTGKNAVRPFLGAYYALKPNHWRCAYILFGVCHLELPSRPPFQGHFCGSHLHVLTHSLSVLHSHLVLTHIPSSSACTAYGRPSQEN